MVTSFNQTIQVLIEYTNSPRLLSFTPFTTLKILSCVVLLILVFLFLIFFNTTNSEDDIQKEEIMEKENNFIETKIDQ